MPCCRRASAVTGAADQAEAMVAGEGGDEDWVAPERSGGAGTATDGNQDDAIPTLGEDAAGRADVRFAITACISGTGSCPADAPSSTPGGAAIPALCCDLATQSCVQLARRSTMTRTRCRTLTTSTSATRRQMRCCSPEASLVELHTGTNYWDACIPSPLANPRHMYREHDIPSADLTPGDRPVHMRRPRSRRAAR